MTLTRAASCGLAALALLGAGCGDEDEGKSDRADAPVKPPPGWRTVKNGDAGFSLAAPRSWTARTKRSATLIRSKDRLIVLTVAADRGETARELDAAEYARRTVESLPGFEGSVGVANRRIRGSPYRTARVDGVGSVSSSRRPQRITVAVFQRPGRVTYTAVVFRNPRVDPRLYESRLRRLLRSFRG